MAETMTDAAPPKGLLARAAAMRPEGGAMPAGGGAPNTASPDAAEGDTPNASPEEQAQYDQFVGNAFKLMYDRALLPKTMESLKGAGDPKEGLAATAVMIGKRVLDSARENGVEIDGAIQMQGGAEIIEHLAEIQREAGIADLSEEEIEGALYRALELYGETAKAEGTLDTEVFAQDFKAMVDADKAGRLDEVVPGATEAAEHMKAVTGRQGGG